MQINKVHIVLLVAAFVVGFFVGKMNVPTPMDAVIEAAKENYAEIKTKTDSEQPAESQSVSKNSSSSEIQSSAGISVGTDSLTDAQVKMLESFGVDTKAITVTAAMIACAEGKLGKARIEEIKNGATPSVLEGVSLLSCYR